MKALKVLTVASVLVGTVLVYAVDSQACHGRRARRCCCYTSCNSGCSTSCESTSSNGCGCSSGESYSYNNNGNSQYANQNSYQRQGYNDQSDRTSSVRAPSNRDYDN